MKVELSHREEIVSIMLTHIRANIKTTPSDFESIWETAYLEYTEGRKLWDLYWATGGNKWKDKFYESPYDCPYQDAHMLTALKWCYEQVCKTLKQESTKQ